MLNVAMMKVKFNFLLCWVSLCWVSLCWVALCWMSWHLKNDTKSAYCCYLFWGQSQEWQNATMNSFKRRNFEEFEKWFFCAKKNCNSEKTSFWQKFLETSSLFSSLFFYLPLKMVGYEPSILGTWVGWFN